MPSSSRNRSHNKQQVKHKFHCLNCFSLMYTRKKYSQFNGTITTYPNSSKPPSYTCRSLTKHLSDVNNADCHSFYLKAAQALLLRKAGNNFDSLSAKNPAIDYESSVVGRNRNNSTNTILQPDVCSTSFITPQNLGLTMTVNGPISGVTNSSTPSTQQQSRDSHSVPSILNHQVIPNTLIPFVDRQAIINATNHAPIATMDQTQAQNGFEDTPSTKIPILTLTTIVFSVLIPTKTKNLFLNRSFHHIRNPPIRTFHSLPILMNLLRNVMIAQSSLSHLTYRSKSISWN